MTRLMGKLLLQAALEHRASISWIREIIRIHSSEAGCARYLDSLSSLPWDPHPDLADDTKSNARLLFLRVLGPGRTGRSPPMAGNFVGTRRPRDRPLSDARVVNAAFLLSPARWHS